MNYGNLVDYKKINKFRIEIFDLIKSEESYIPYMVTVTFNKYKFKYDNRLNNIYHSIKRDKIYDPDKHHKFMIHRQAKAQAMPLDSYGIKTTEKDIYKIQKTYDILMGHIPSALVKNYNRLSKRHLHPFTYDFIDIRGTKHKNPVVDEDDTLHIHGIWLIHRDVKPIFDDLREKKFYPILIHPSLTGIRDMHAQEVYNLPGAIKYCSKAMELPAGYILDPFLLYSQHPICSSERAHKKAFAREKYGNGVKYDDEG